MISCKTTFLENWGSRARRIIDACKRQNVEKPVWSTQGGFVIVTFKRPAKDSSTAQGEANLPPTYHQLVTNLSHQVKALTICLKATEKSIPGLQKTINLSLKSRRLFKEQYIDKALEQGLIVMVHPESPRHPQQKYKLSEKGIIVLNTASEESV